MQIELPGMLSKICNFAKMVNFLQRNINTLIELHIYDQHLNLDYMNIAKVQEIVYPQKMEACDMIGHHLLG